MPEGKTRSVNSEMVSFDLHDRGRMCRRTNLQYWFFALLMIAVSFGGYSEMSCAADAARGKLLYETSCNECHTKSVSGRPNRAAKSVSDIRKRVIQWESYKGYHWSKEEVEDVTQYLNDRFYKY
jgi:cytochrome c2